jgi:transcriptional regulator with XRE-family HTH domain
MLRCNAQLSSYPAEKPIESGSLCQLWRDTFKVVGQVEPSEYETDHTTAFIYGQEDFSVQGKTEVLGLIAERIRLLRGELKLRQEEFAERLGQDQTTISKWERAKARPTPEALVKLAMLASDVDKLFFLGHAGLPKEYLMGEPMIPELKAASSRVIQKAVGSRSESSRTGPLWDPELLTFVIETIEAGLQKRKRRLPPEKYAAAVILAYEHCYFSGQRDAKMLGRLLKIA